MGYYHRGMLRKANEEECGVIVEYLMDIEENLVPYGLFPLFLIFTIEESNR